MRTQDFFLITWHNLYLNTFCFILSLLSRMEIQLCTFLFVSSCSVNEKTNSWWDCNYWSVSADMSPPCLSKTREDIHHHPSFMLQFWEESQEQTCWSKFFQNNVSFFKSIFFSLTQCHLSITGYHGHHKNKK